MSSAASSASQPASQPASKHNSFSLKLWHRKNKFQKSQILVKLITDLRIHWVGQELEFGSTCAFRDCGAHIVTSF
jgi:hypothetical protein